MNIYYPWTPRSELPHSKADVDVILSHLNRLNFPIDLYKEPPDSRVIAALNQIIGIIHQKKGDRESVPWVILISQSERALQSLATLVPWTYALTTKTSCMVVKTEELIDWFKVRPPVNDMDFDPVGNQLTEIQRTGTLALERIDGGTTYTTSYGGKVLSLLEYRLKYRKITMFTASHNSKNVDAAEEEIDLAIEQGFGRKVQQIISNNANLIHLKIQNVPPETTEITI